MMRLFMRMAVAFFCVQSIGAREPNPSRRSLIPSFKVMDVVAKAAALEAEGRRIFHLEVIFSCQPDGFAFQFPQFTEPLFKSR